MRNTARIELKEYLIKELDDIIEIYSDLKEIQKGLIIARNSIKTFANIYILEKKINEASGENKGVRK